MQIIGVLQSVSDSEEETAVANMQAICDNVFVSKDTQGFSEAVNDAIANAYGTYTLIDTVDSDFELMNPVFRYQQETSHWEKMKTEIQPLHGLFMVCLLRYIPCLFKKIKGRRWCVSKRYV
ncbi:MAG: hypothetical protein ACLSCV_01795 [Acutalibacteraceae bacterium]